MAGESDRLLAPPEDGSTSKFARGERTVSYLHRS